MEEKDVIVGVYTYYSYKREVDVISWWDGQIRIDKDMDYLSVDESYDYENNICYDYSDISELMFNVLESAILNKKMDIIIDDDPKISFFSSFVFEKENLIHQVIVDENNFVYFINTIKKTEKNHLNYPLEIMDYLLLGLKNAGFRKVNIKVDET